jgi:hypothetical protein
MPIDQAEFDALRELVRENTGDEMMLLNRFTVRGMRHALGMELESGIEPLVRNGVIVEKAGHYEFAPEIQRALVREELGDSLRVAEAITRLRLGKQTTGLETPDMQKGAYRARSLAAQNGTLYSESGLADGDGPSEEPVGTTSGIRYGRDHLFAGKGRGQAERGTAAKARPRQRAGAPEVVNHANEQGCDRRLCLEDGGSETSPFRPSRSPCPGGREHPIRGWRRRNAGTHELAQPQFLRKACRCRPSAEKGRQHIRRWSDQAAAVHSGATAASRERCTRSWCAFVT